MDIKKRIQLGFNLRKQGYNCSQSVVGAYVDILDITNEQAMKIASGFGGGFGGQRGLCGCLSGAGMVLSIIYGQETVDPIKKKELNVMITNFCEEFKEVYHSIDCGELLGIKETRFEKKQLNCDELIKNTILLLDTYV